MSRDVCPRKFAKCEARVSSGVGGKESSSTLQQKKNSFPYEKI